MELGIIPINTHSFSTDKVMSSDQKIVGRRLGKINNHDKINNHPNSGSPQNGCLCFVCFVLFLLGKAGQARISLL